MEREAIADKLGISVHTANTHIAAGIARLGARNAKDAARIVADHDRGTTGLSTSEFLRVEAAGAGGEDAPDEERSSMLRDVQAGRATYEPAPPPPEAPDSASGGRRHDALTNTLMPLALIGAIAAAIVALLLAAPLMSGTYQGIANTIEPFHR